MTFTHWINVDATHKKIISNKCEFVDKMISPHVPFCSISTDFEYITWSSAADNVFYGTENV